MKKTWPTVLTALIVFTLLLTGCSKAGQQEADRNSNGQTGETDKLLTLKVFTHQDSTFDLETNTFTKQLEQQFNVKFDWSPIPFDGATEKRQISLASGDFPDLFWLIPFVDRFSQTDLLKFGQQGVILPLNDLIDQHAPHIKAVLDGNEYYKAMNTAPDGNIYGLNGLTECFHCSYPNKLWLNTKWLDELGLPMPKTTEDFKKVLTAFKTQDPNRNGKADEVPLSGSVEDYGVRIIPFLMNGFIYNDDRTYLIMKDGKVDIAANKPEWKEGLAYIHSLYEEGLIDPGAFTQNAEAFKRIGYNADAQLLGAGAGMHPAIFIDTGTEGPYNKDYNPLAPLQGPHANYSSFNFPIEAGASFVLTNKASKDVQIRAIKILDYIYTQEGALRGIYGEEGINWAKPEEGDVALNEKVEPLFKSLPGSEEGSNRGWGPLAQYNQDRAQRDAQVQGSDIYGDNGYERRLYEATLLYEGKEPESVFPHWALWVDPADTDEASIIQVNIKDYIDQSALQFITGNKSLEKDWDAYVKGLEALNLNRYLEIMQKSYDVSTIK